MDVAEMKWENTLMAYKEDIKNRDFWDWVKAHTSFMKPLHRYEGVDITDIHFGFDDVFTGWEERAAPWNKPLRVIYKFKEARKTVYLFVNFHHRYGMRTSDNKEVYEKLKVSVER